MILHTYFRSGASIRVRIALALKKLDPERRHVHLRRGEQRSDGFLALNPQGLLPVLEVEGARITQSLAMLEYLDERYPDPPLLPPDPVGRARVRSLCQILAVDTHPLGNLRVLAYLREELGADDDAVAAWYNHWIASGLAAFEARLAEPETGRFCHGDTVGMADVCLVAQVANAGRFGLDLSPYPTVMRIHGDVVTMDAFRAALPENQPDAE